MDKELIQLLERLSDLPDDDLIRIINHDSADYRPEVIALARVLMVRRGYSVTKKGMVAGKGQAHAQKSNQSQPEAPPSEGGGGQGPDHPELNRGLIQIKCVRCKGKLDYVGTRRLHEDKSLSVLGELGEMYKEGPSEFLDVYVCSKCGHAELFADGIGEDLRPQ